MIGQNLYTNLAICFILNKLTLQKELQNYMPNNVFLDNKKHKNKKSNIKKCQSWKLNPGPLEHKADSLLLHHQL